MNLITKDQQFLQLHKHLLTTRESKLAFMGSRRVSLKQLRQIQSIKNRLKSII